MLNVPPAHKVVGDIGKPGQVVYTVTGRAAVEHKPVYPNFPLSDSMRLKYSYDCLFYNPPK